MIDFPHSEDYLINCISKALRANVQREGDRILFKVGGQTESEFLLDLSKLRELLSSIRAKDLFEETALYTDTSFEILVKEESYLPTRRVLQNEGICITDSESTITYEVSPASDEYLLWLIATASSKGLLPDLGFGLFPMRMRLEGFLAMQKPGDPDPDALDALRTSYARFITLKLRSTSKPGLRRFQTAAYSFFFHLAFNLDIALVPQRFLEGISRRGRISRMRRSTTGELDPPRRVYSEDLVNHYTLAISTDNPTVQFLSHYHVLEYFFESVFNDDLIEQIKSSITQPGFSYKRKKDIVQLISMIKKSLQIRSESITFSEIEALRLVLSRFINVSQLTAQLEDYDSSLVDYYKDTDVPFSKGAKVDLRDGENKQTLKDLVRRIYATRNALVHNKEGDKARYTPFKDERALIMEVPLMRFISEMVILAVSEVV